MNNETGFDIYGAWFEGVELLASKNLTAVNVETAKSKDVAIVGAGMAGLMTYLVLLQAGFTKLSIIEASDRLGGRIHTEYLSGGPFDYSYQEMSAMRFPATFSVPAANLTLNFSDHQIVFQLAGELNQINNHAKNLSVDFIPWIQTDPNGLQYYNEVKLPSGLPPTSAHILGNSSLGHTLDLNPSTLALIGAVTNYLSPEIQLLIITNSFKAHSQWIESGLKGMKGDEWSEFGFMVNFLKGTLNDTDVLITAFGGEPAASFWYTLYESVFFSAATMKTIDGGRFRETSDRITLICFYLLTNVNRCQSSSACVPTHCRQHHNFRSFRGAH